MGGPYPACRPRDWLIEPPAGPDCCWPARLRALPNGFQPEGIAIGPGRVAYFGSRADGSIYRAGQNRLNLVAVVTLNRRGRRGVFTTPPTPTTPDNVVAINRP